MGKDLPYQHIPEPPVTFDGRAVIVRLIDGLGFRYRWATEDLRESDYDFQPADDVRSIRQLMDHIWDLVHWINHNMTGVKADRPNAMVDVRSTTLRTLLSLRQKLLEIENETIAKFTINKLPIWNYINGPLADALTHVGQINSFRRMAGNPIPRVNVFKGVGRK